MKNKTITILLIIILSLIAIILSVFMVKMINGHFKLTNINFGHNVSNELVIDETYTEIFSEIYINTDASDINIKESIDNQIRVIIYGNKDRTIVDTTNNSLTITSKSKPCIGFCFNNQIAKVEVYLPSTYENKINIKNKYGDVEVGNFKKAIININEDAGDVVVTSGDEVTIDNKYGNIKLEEANIINIKASAGDVKVDVANNITIKNNYGDIIIENANEYLNVECDAGNIKINNINISKNSKIENSYGDISIGKTNEIYINADNDLGDIKINNNYPKSEIILDIQNACGDIKVKN